MDTKKVTALLLAVERGSLTKAADELGYTQSGLTHMMNALESELGLKLLVRSKSGISLAPAGQALLEPMKKLSKCAEELEHDVELLRQKGSTTLRVGVFSSMTRQWVPAILVQLKQFCPDIEIQISKESLDDTYRDVLSGALDCAIVSSTPNCCDLLSWVPLRDDPLVAVVPKDWHVEGDVFPVERFDGQKFLMPPSGFAYDALPALASAGRPINPDILNTNLEDAEIASMVSHGLGVSILSELIMQSIDEEVDTYPLAPPAARHLGIIYSNEPRNTGKNVGRFIACAQYVIERLYK